MKRLSLLAFVLLAATGCAGTTPPPAAPPPPPPPPTTTPTIPPPPSDPAPVTEGDVTVAFSRGMEILVKRTPGAEFVAAQLFIRGGTRNWTKENAGIESLALDVATSGGTKSLAKDPYSRKLASLGASLGGGAQDDYSVVATKAPLSAWDELFPIFAETFTAPALPSSEFDIAKQRTLAYLRHEASDGEGRLHLLARRAVFAGHPYANRPSGFVETVESMKSGDLAPYLDKLHDTNRLVLVVVGDLDPTHVVDQAKTAFAAVPRGAYVETPMPPLKFNGAHVAGDSFKLPTNYIESIFAGPSWSEPDFAALRLGMGLLGERVFDEVRTKRNLSYAPSAYFNFHTAATYGLLSVTAVDPNTTMTVMFSEAHRLESELIPPKELAGMKAVYVTSNDQHHETVDGQASALGEAILLGGDWHLVRLADDRLKAATAEEVKQAAAKWITNVQTAIVGDPAKLDPKVVGAQ